MTFDWRNGRFAVGPYVHVGYVTLIRLWRWDYVRVGGTRKIVRHEEWG